MGAAGRKNKTKERDLRIYEYLRKELQAGRGFPTMRQIASALSISSLSLVEASFLRLEQEGLIRREGRKRSLPGLYENAAVPLLGTIAAGAPLLAVEQIEGYLPIQKELARGRSLFALRVRGESMINAGILPGDTVVFEQTPILENGEIGAILLEEEATVKRFFKERDHIRLQPENDEMEPIRCTDCKILGRLVALVRNYE